MTEQNRRYKEGGSESQGGQGGYCCPAFVGQAAGRWVSFAADWSARVGALGCSAGDARLARSLVLEAASTYTHNHVLDWVGVQDGGDPRYAVCTKPRASVAPRKEMWEGRVYGH